MTYIWAILAGFFASLLFGFSAGQAAAMLFARLGGDHHGANSSFGFFTVGPFGLVSGFLFVTGAMLRWSSGIAIIGNGMMIAGVTALMVGAVVILFAVANRPGVGLPGRCKLQLEFEAASASAIAREKLESLRWGYTDEVTKHSTDFPVWNRRCSGGVCVLTTRMDCLDHPERREVLFVHSGTKQRFEIPPEGMMNRPADWSEWQRGEGLRFRWKSELAR